MKGITREQAKPIINGQGMKINSIYISAKTYRNYDDYKESAAYADGWNAAMDYVFGVNPNKPDIELVQH